MTDNREQESNISKVDTLIIIGNGFDLWQGLPTSYSNFEKYYVANRDKIMKKLHIKPIRVVGSEGNTNYISDVEILYEDALEELGSDFWYAYEDSLNKIDDQRINLFFGKERSDLKRIEVLVDNAKKILQEAFSEWIMSIDVNAKDSGYIFPPNCFVINFNYTDTAIKRFGVSKNNICFIHGEATDKESIIVGHAAHPEVALPVLKRMGGRFEGLYYIEKALFETDKHVDNNYHMLAIQIALLSGYLIEDIKDVYILGHGFGEADYGYFRHLAHAMNGEDEDPFEGIDNWALEYLLDCDESDFLDLNLHYAINHRARMEKSADIEELPGLETLKLLDEIIERNIETPYYKLDDSSELEKAAVRARFLMEQAYRDAEYELLFMEILSKQHKGGKRLTGSMKRKILEESIADWEDIKSIIRDTLKARNAGRDFDDKTSKKAPLWHITCYSDNSRKRVEDVMKRIHYSNYKIYPTIDECIKDFKVSH